MFPFLSLGFLALAMTFTNAATPTVKRETDISSQFVQTKNGQFVVNGRYSFPLPLTLPSSLPTSVFKFIGTNAYWLPALNSDDDIDNTLASIAASGVTVVRTWAFNGAIYHLEHS